MCVVVVCAFFLIPSAAIRRLYVIDERSRACKQPSPIKLIALKCLHYVMHSTYRLNLVIGHVRCATFVDARARVVVERARDTHAPFASFHFAVVSRLTARKTASSTIDYGARIDRKGYEHIMAFVQDVTPAVASSRYGTIPLAQDTTAVAHAGGAGDGARKSGRARKISKALRVVDATTRAEVAAARLDSLESDVAIVPGAGNGASEGVESDDEEFVFNENARDGEAQIVKGAKKAKRTTRGVAENRRAVAARTFNSLLEQSFVDRVPKDIPTYLTAAATASTSSAPRKFCSVCGFAAPYGCARCGMRFCSKKCSAVHAETRCLKMVG